MFIKGIGISGPVFQLMSPQVEIAGFIAQAIVALTGAGTFLQADLLQARIRLPLGGDLALAIFVDAFNVLDSDTITNVREQWGWYVYDYQDHPGGSFWDPSSRFEEPESIQTPREIRIGEIVASMSRAGNCYDNAAMESFFGTLKCELIHDRHYRTRAEARQDIFEYIEVFYNRKRRHSSLGYLSPVSYEELCQLCLK